MTAGVGGSDAATELEALRAGDSLGFYGLLPGTPTQANPALGARLLTAFEQWRILEPQAKAAAETTLKRLQAAGLSSNAADIVARALG